LIEQFFDYAQRISRLETDNH